MIAIKTWVLPLIFTFFSISTVLSAEESVPFATDLPYEEFARLEEPLTVDQMTDLFLIASGVSREKMEGYRNRIRRLLKESDSVDGAEELLHFMHNNYLKRYNTVQTRLDVLLDKGTYNCVSSAVLYMILTRYHGIPAEGIQTRDHAFCILPEEDRGFGIDVETTSEWGYNPGEKKEFSSSFTNRTGFAYVPPGNYRERRRMGDRDMAGLILQNRIVELQRKNRHIDALPLGADRLVLTGSEQARQDYFSTIQNVAAYYNGLKKYNEAIDILDRAEEGLDEFPGFLFSIRSQIIYNAAAACLNKNDIDSAEVILKERSESLTDEERSQLIIQISIRDLELRAKEPFSDELIADIRRAADEGILTEIRALSLAVFHYSRKAETLTRNKEYRQVYEFLKDVPEWLNRDREYRRIFSMARDNWGIDYHNKIISLFNEGKKEEARLLLNEALQNLPDDHRLKDDKQKLGF